MARKKWEDMTEEEKRRWKEVLRLRNLRALKAEKKRRARVAKIYAGHPKGWKPPSFRDPAGRARIHAALKRRKKKSKVLKRALRS